MELAPTIDEVQQAIDSSWRAAALHAAPAPRVLQTLLFFTSSEEIAAYAVVDAHAGSSFHAGGRTVETVSRNAAAVKSLMNCRIGETVSFADDQLLLLARNGGAVPSMESCLAAMACQERMQSHARALFSELDEIGHLLSKQRVRLQQARLDFARFPELSRAVEELESDLENIAGFEKTLTELRALPAQRDISRLSTEMDNERACLRDLRDDVERCVARQSETIEPHLSRHAVLERERVAGEAYIQEERARIELLYHETMRLPPMISQDEAAEEFREIVKLADTEGSDTFILLRRLFILRLRCHHAIDPPIGDGVLRTLLPDIEEEIHRLRRR